MNPNGAPKKDRCINGHENPERFASGACKACMREYNAKNRDRYKVLSFKESCALINAIRHMLGLDDLPWEARSE